MLIHSVELEYNITKRCTINLQLWL